MTAIIDQPQPLLVKLPRAYGYMRVPCDIPDEKVFRLEQEVRAFAESRGRYLVSFFFEFHCGSHEAFEELVEELVRQDVHCVVVPSLRHLAHHARLQDLMLEQMNRVASAEIMAMRERTEIE
ncbi:hypothetical protein [Amycolatopsis sp. CA-126428]|uniref:hypothetical protein n=1 Tax=Amycolatopsis sp. CA-126428 TaxID=2073158 RepID=UPI0011B01636|nr:hypothetical protein [Amycolatopsis sp. CA-126428]